MRFLLDQNLPRRAADILRQEGWDCLHVGEVGLAHACDADFHALLAVRRATGPSVVRIRIEDLDAARTAELMHLVFERFRDDLQTGAVVSITATKSLPNN